MKRAGCEILEATKKIVALALENASKPGRSSFDNNECAREIHKIMQDLCAEFEESQDLDLFMQLWKEINVLYKKHGLAANGLPISVLHSKWCNDDTGESFVRGVGGRNPEIKLKKGDISGTITMLELENIAENNTSLPTNLICSPLPSKLSDKQIVARMEKLGNAFAHLNLEVPVALHSIFGVLPKDATEFNNTLRLAKITVGAFETTFQQFYYCSTELGAAPKDLKAEWTKRMHEVVLKEELSWADSKDPVKIQEYSANIEQKLKKVRAELERIEQGPTSNNVYRSVNLLLIINELYTSFNRSISTYNNQGSHPYTNLLFEFYNIIRLELEERYTSPRDIPQFLRYTAELKPLFNNYISTHTQRKTGLSELSQYIIF